MDRIYSNKQEMYNTTLKVLDDNLTIWGTNPAFKSIVDTITANNGQITIYDQLDRSTLSISAQKKQVFESMLDATEVICGAGVPYAISVKNNALKAKFDFSRSDLKEGTAKEACTHCVNVWNAADPIKALLIPFNMPATQCDIQQLLTTEFNTLISGPREVRTDGKSARELMIILFAQNDALLNDSLDNMMKTYKAANPEFFVQYTNARFIGGWRKKKKVVPPTTTDSVKKTVVTTTPIVEIPQVDETPVVEEAPVVEETPVEEIPVVNETPVVETKPTEEGN